MKNFYNYDDPKENQSKGFYPLIIIIIIIFFITLQTETSK